MRIFASGKSRGRRKSRGSRSMQANDPAPHHTTGEASTTSQLWSDQFGRLATRSVQIIAVAVVVAFVVFVMMQIKIVVIPALMALILASALYPLIRRMRRLGIRPGFAAFLSLFGLASILGGLGWLVVWRVQGQWDELVVSADEGIQQLLSYVQTLPFTISSEQIDDAKQVVVDFLTSSQFGSGAWAGASATAAFFAGFALMVVLLFAFLKDGPQLWEFLLRPLTGEKYDRGRRIGEKTVQTLGGYVRGTMTVAAADALGIGIGLFIIGVPLVLPLMVIVFLAAFIPLVGATFAGIVAALVALVANGPIEALIVLAVVIVVNQVESNFLQPVVMARSLKLHPLVVLLALIIGTLFGGIVGAVIAVPIAAVAWRIVTVWNGPQESADLVEPKRMRHSRATIENI